MSSPPSEDERQSEYNSFGPWIDVVDSPAAAPRLYRDHPLDFERSRMVLKVPRDIARRDANASMDLYDHLLIVDDEQLTCLARVESGYEQRGLRLSELVVLEHSTDLLLGQLSLTTIDGTSMRVPFNGAGLGRIVALVDLLRALTDGTAASDPLDSHLSSVRAGDLGLAGNSVVAAANEALRADHQLRLLAAHRSERLYSRSGLIRTILDRFIPVTLHAAAVVASPTELIVF